MQRRRRLKRIAFPIAIVGVMLLSVVAITGYSYQRNRAAVLDMSEEVLKAARLRVKNRVRAYLAPASNSVRAAAQLLETVGIQDTSASLVEAIALVALRDNDQLSAFFAGDSEGNSLYIEKAVNGALHTRTIEQTPEGRTATWIRRNPQGKAIAKEIVEDDAYDARTRPWYLGAQEKGQLVWSDVYAFYSLRVLGVTVSHPVFSKSGKLVAVVGTDLTLGTLSNFVSELEITENERALIVDENGVLIGFPEPELALREVDKELRTVNITELDDPVLTRVWNYSRVRRTGVHELEVDGKQYFAASISLADVVGREWSVLVAAPTSSFVGFVAENSRRVLVMTGAVMLLAAVLAALLVQQGLRADRNAGLALRRQGELESQSKAYSELAAKAASFAAGDERVLGAITEIAGQGVETRRVSIWRFQPAAKCLTCQDCFDLQSSGHTQGMILEEAHFPSLWSALVTGQELLVADAATDPRTAELFRGYLEPLGCRSLLSVPVTAANRVIGTVWFEHAVSGLGWADDALALGRVAANVIKLRLEETWRQEDGDGKTQRATDLDAVTGGPEVVARERAASETAGRGIARAEGSLLGTDRTEALRQRWDAWSRNNTAELGAEIVRDVTVLVLVVVDPLSLAARPGNEMHETVADRLVQGFEDRAHANGIEYLRIVGTQMVAAAGFDGNVAQGAHAIADLGLAVKKDCEQLFSEFGRRLVYQMGIDTGPVMGSVVGRDQPAFNLWGEALDMATRMANTGVEGAIHLTESSYRLVGDRFLLTLRGRYYHRGTGEFSTYLLASRL